MANLILSAKSNPKVTITGKKEMDHTGLKNLGFEESGHTGFQPALTEDQLKNIEKVMDIEKKADNNASAIDGLQTDVASISSRIYRLIRKITVEEDVATLTISTDEEGKSFKLSDFVIRFSGKHTGTMWIGLGKSEKYVSTNQINNNLGLPFYSTVSYSLKNAIVHYIYSGSNYYGIKYEQMIGNLTDGTYSAGAGSIAPFNTSSVSSLASQVCFQAISTNGVIKAGTVIEIWGY